MRLQFAEALLCAEWVFGPYDLVGDLRNEGKPGDSYREDRMTEAECICRAVQEPTLAEVADVLGAEVYSVDHVAVDMLAGRVMESARRIVAARPPFYEAP